MLAQNVVEEKERARDREASETGRPGAERGGRRRGERTEKLTQRVFLVPTRISCGGFIV
jgi:hypothetical protein